MSLIAAGHVVHAGTLNGNPLALAAAKAALLVLQPDRGRVYPELHRRGNILRAGMERILRDAGFSALTTGEGPVFALHFAERAPNSYRDTLRSDRSLYSDFALALLDEGIMVLPDGRWYMSAAHTDAHVDETLAAIRRITS
jgi:glutamate-1-semialdehyde 2,1-aminomutase